MSKKLLITAVLFPTFVVAEQTTFHINPKTSIPFSLTKTVSGTGDKFEYYIQDSYGTDVFKSRENPENVNLDGGAVRERFITNTEEYTRPNSITLTWNFKTKQDKWYKGLCSDGEYTLHLMQTDRKNPRCVNETLYTIILDTTKPTVLPRMNATTIFRNRRETVVIDVSNFAKKDSIGSWKVLLDDEILYKGKSFPGTGIPMRYEKYAGLSDGRHKIAVYAEDLAGNSNGGEEIQFLVSEHPCSFSIFSTGGIVRNPEGNAEPYRFTAIGMSANRWRARILDSDGKEVHSASAETSSDEPCEPFIWNGTTDDGEIALEGEYTAEITGTNSHGNTATNRTHFTISNETPQTEIRTETKTETVVVYKDAEFGKPPQLAGRFQNGTFVLELKNSPDNVKSAQLQIESNGKIVRKCEINDTGNIIWNGLDSYGEQIVSTGELYTFALTFNSGEDETTTYATIRAGLVLEGDDRRKKIMIPSVKFDADDASVFSETEFFVNNAENIRKTANALISALNKDEMVIISGNANYTTDPNDARRNDETIELRTLSRKRAETVARVLEFYGLPRKQMRIEANGGDCPLTKFDGEDSWKNRRVEFFVEKISSEANGE